MNYIKVDCLTQLLGCYFHQDWSDEFKDDRAVINEIIDIGPEEQIAKGVAEIDSILKSGISEGDLRTILIDRIGCYLEPLSIGYDYVQWLRRVRSFLKRND